MEGVDGVRVARLAVGCCDFHTPDEILAEVVRDLGVAGDGAVSSPSSDTVCMCAYVCMCVCFKIKID